MGGIADPLEGTGYRALGLLGRGKLSEVFEAEKVGLGKRVAVKLVHRDLGHLPDLPHRLRFEAQVLARLESPFLVQVLDMGVTPGGERFLAMERLSGRTLAEELAERGALPPPEAVLLAQQTLLGLDVAHRAGIVHRDVKPANLFLHTAPGAGSRVMKVLDFGIAKLVAPRDPEGDDPRRPQPPPSTADGATLIGTPAFSAPEQFLSGVVDARTDVYAAGLVLFTMLKGQPPFAAQRGAVEVAKAHAYEVPPSPAIEPTLDAIVLRALEKKPDDRWPTAREMADALAGWLDGVAAGSGARRAQWLWTGVGAALFTAAILGALFATGALR